MYRKTGVAAVIIGSGVICSGCGVSTDDSGREGILASALKEGAELATAQLLVEGMTCGGCVLATEMAVKRLEGVTSVDARLDEETGGGYATVEYDPALIGTGAIAAAIRETGFTPRLERADRGENQTAERELRFQESISP